MKHQSSSLSERASKLALIYDDTLDAFASKECLHFGTAPEPRAEGMLQTHRYRMSHAQSKKMHGSNGSSVPLPHSRLGSRAQVGEAPWKTCIAQYLIEVLQAGETATRRRKCGAKDVATLCLRTNSLLDHRPAQIIMRAGTHFPAARCQAQTMCPGGDGPAPGEEVGNVLATPCQPAAGNFTTCGWPVKMASSSFSARSKISRWRRVRVW